MHIFSYDSDLFEELTCEKNVLYIGADDNGRLHSKTEKQSKKIATDVKRLSH